jgi:hypothetical protein
LAGEDRLAGGDGSEEIGTEMSREDITILVFMEELDFKFHKVTIKRAGPFWLSRTRDSGQTHAAQPPVLAAPHGFLIKFLQLAFHAPPEIRNRTALLC